MVEAQSIKDDITGIVQHLYEDIAFEKKRGRIHGGHASMPTKLDDSIAFGLWPDINILRRYNVERMLLTLVC